MPRNSAYLKKLVYSKDYETKIQKGEEFSVAKLFDIEFQMMKSLEEYKNLLYQSLNGDYYTLVAMMLDSDDMKYSAQKHYNNYMLKANKVKELSQKCGFYVNDADTLIFFGRIAKVEIDHIFANSLINSIIPYKTQFSCFSSLDKKSISNENTKEEIDNLSEIKLSSKKTYSAPLNKYYNSDLKMNYPDSLEVKDKDEKKNVFYSSFGLKNNIIPSNSEENKIQETPIKILNNSTGLVNFLQTTEYLSANDNQTEGKSNSSFERKNLIKELNSFPKINGDHQQNEENFNQLSPEKISMISDILPETNEEILLFLLENMSEILKERELMKVEFLKTTGISVETLFSMFDLTKKKRVSILDFRNVIKSLELSFENEMFKLMFLRYDTDFDGFLNFEEFTKLVKPIKFSLGNISSISFEFKKTDDFSKYSNSEFKRRISRLLMFLLRCEEAWEFLKTQLAKSENFNYYNAFDAIDMNGDSYITLEDIKEFSSSRGVNIECNEIFDLFDKTCSSKLSYDQFYKELTPFNQ